MKKQILFFTLLLSTLVSSCHNSKEIQLKVMTFNIRYDNPGDKENNWKYRKETALTFLEKKSPDLLGGQEVLHNQLIDMKKGLPAYSVVGVGRLDGKTKGEYAPIFFKKERFNLIKSGYFWLSETPSIVGKKGWDAACERIATWVVLQDKQSLIQFVFLNTHFDHVGTIARHESVLLIKRKIKELSLSETAPFVVCGDFNVTMQSDAYRTMLESGLRDSRVVALEKEGPDKTFHDFGRIPKEKQLLIDYIFVSKKINVLKNEVIESQYETTETYLSDHNPVMSTLMLKSTD